MMSKKGENEEEELEEEEEEEERFGLTRGGPMLSLPTRKRKRVTFKRSESEE